MLNTSIRALYVLAAVTTIASPAASAIAAALPDELTVIYRVELGSIRLGRLVTTLRKMENDYAVEAVTRAEGIAAILLRGRVRETCRFQADGSGIKPNKYLRIKEGFGASTNRTEFDWQHGTIKFADGSGEPIPKGYVVDNCSAPFAYMRDGRNGFDKQTLHIVGHKRVYHYDLVSITPETLSLPIGELKTLRVEHKRQGSDKRFIVWLAAERNYMPVKIVEKRKSRTISMIAEKVELN